MAKVPGLKSRCLLDLIFFSVIPRWHKSIVSIGEEKLVRIRALPTVQNVDRRRKRSRCQFTLGKLTG